MSRHYTNIILIASVILALAILGGLVWANTTYVRSQPLEKDFLVPWLAARTFIQYGDSPYSNSATQRAQIVYYGQLAVEGQDPLTLWLPFPVELFYFPFALVSDYALARALWMTCLEVALAALAYLSLRLTGWKPARFLLPLVFLFSILGVYGAISLAGASGAAFASLALAGCLFALGNEQDELAGALLLISLGLPSLTGLLGFFLIWWVIHRRRWRVLWGFLMTLAILLALSFLLLPDWVFPNIVGWVTHLRYVTTFSSVDIFTAWSPIVGSRLGWVMAALLLLLLFVEWGAALRNEFRHLLWTVSLTLAAAPLMGVPVALTSYVIFFLPLILILSVLVKRRSNAPRLDLAGILLMVLFAGLWILTGLLASAGAYRALAETLFLHVPVLLISGLYWMRWRFIRKGVLELEPYQ